jgi:hypothetical protein
MPDNKSKRGKPDRSRVAGEEPYEVAYFAKKHEITQDQARRLIRILGNDRAKLDAAAAKIGRARS